jgi:hypothetical protein
VSNHRRDRVVEYCASGDKTVEALQCAIREVVAEPADDYFVFLVSDANLRRYNVNPDAIARLMSIDIVCPTQSLSLSLSLSLSVRVFAHDGERF